MNNESVDSALIEYVRGQRAKGVVEEDIRTALLTEGWTHEDIGAAFAITQQASPHAPSPIAPTAEAARTPTYENKNVTYEQQGDGASSLQKRDVFQSTEPAQGSPSGKKSLVILIVFAALLVVGGGSVYAYFTFFNTSRGAPYTQENFLSGLLEQSAKMETARYTMEGSLMLEPREIDAKPFTYEPKPDPNFAKSYRNDFARMEDIRKILFLAELDVFDKKIRTLDEMIANPDNNDYVTSYNPDGINDPVTKKQYEFRVIDGGENFELVVTFETDHALSAIRGAYEFVATSTIINDKTVTFTKESGRYYSMPPEPRKPYLVVLGELARFLPSEISFALSVSGATDLRDVEFAEWEFAFEAEGDFGDLTYKVAADAIRKDENYYFRIRNIPSILGSTLSSLKGKWVAISPSAQSTTTQGYDYLSYLRKEFPEYEQEYRQHRQEYFTFLRTIAEIADAEQLLSFITEPRIEERNEEKLYRYDVRINKDKIIPFVEKALEEASKNDAVKRDGLYNDRGLLDYLKSEEFDATFDYYDKNTKMSLLVDMKGNVRTFEYSMRIIPPDTATPLLGKQAKVVLVISFDEINNTLSIDIPPDAVPIEKLIEETNKNENMYSAGATTKSRDARRISDIKQLQIAAELYYDAHGTYPTTINAVAPDYIFQIPSDPTTQTPYFYAVSSDGETYHIGASLEDLFASSLASDDDCNSLLGSCGGHTFAKGNLFNGSDEQGCNGESDRACYDVTN